MGTYYSVTCDCPRELPIRALIDSSLLAINQEVSTYISDSYISSFNRSTFGKDRDLNKVHFNINYDIAKEVYGLSDGYFDVSVMPLVNHWGFGYTPKITASLADTVTVDSILSYIGFDKIIKLTTSDSLVKSDPRQQLDFSALAKGYAVDVISNLLSSYGCTNHLVDIGGELVAKGHNSKDALWNVGINTPDTKAEYSDISVKLSLTNMAIASSGNYRNFHEYQGQKYGHTINPFTGFPYQDSLLAVSIITNQCIYADAYATACMAMGFERAIKFINKLEQTEACFLIGASDGTIQKKYTDGFIQYIAK